MTTPTPRPIDLIERDLTLWQSIAKFPINAQQIERANRRLVQLTEEKAEAI